MSPVFQIESLSGYGLSVDDGGRLQAGQPYVSGSQVFLVCPSVNPCLGFMFAQNLAPISIGGSAFVEAIQPWRVRWCGQYLTLHDPEIGWAVVIEKSGGTELQGPSDGDGGSPLVVKPVGNLSLLALDVLQKIDRLTPANLNGPDMLDMIGSSLNIETAAVVQAILRLLPRDQIEWLGGTLLGLPDHLRHFSEAFPADIWASRAMPDLRDWLATRPLGTHVRIPPATDFLAARGYDGRFTSIGHMLNAAARAHVPPRKTVCVVATARNEGPYLVEWVAYHRAIGAQAIFIYSNDNSDGSNDLLRALAEAGQITWIENESVGVSAQLKAYGHAFGILPDLLEYRWSLVIDLDEFFAFDVSRYANLPDYIAWHETRKVDAVAMNWLVFGSAGASQWVDRPLIERFTVHLPWLDEHVKSLSRTNQCIHSRPHHAIFGSEQHSVTRNSDGGIHSSRDDPSLSVEPRANNAWIAHYFLKSAHEFVWKNARNRGDQMPTHGTNPNIINDEFIDLFVKQHGSPTMIDDRRILSCVPGLDREIDRLLNLPGVAGARNCVLESYRSGLSKLLDGMRTSGKFQDPGSPSSTLLRFCET